MLVRHMYFSTCGASICDAPLIKMSPLVRRMGPGYRGASHSNVPRVRATRCHGYNRATSPLALPQSRSRSVHTARDSAGSRRRHRVAAHATVLPCRSPCHRATFARCAATLPRRRPTAHATATHPPVRCRRPCPGRASPRGPLHRATASPTTPPIAVVVQGCPPPLPLFLVYFRSRIDRCTIL